MTMQYNRKGSRWRQLSGDPFIFTQSIPNLPSGYPSAEKDWNLFCMHPGSEAALSAPWWSCLLVMKKRTGRWVSVGQSFGRGGVARVTFTYVFIVL